MNDATIIDDTIQCYPTTTTDMPTTEVLTTDTVTTEALTYDATTTDALTYDATTTEALTSDATTTEALTYDATTAEALTSTSDYPCCTCVSAPINITIDEAIEETQEIKKELEVDKKTLSATIRKLTSAHDDRSSSKTIGVIGAICLATPLVLILVLDAPYFVAWACR